jgi:3-isopropylmalate/(R)-2-methylmalate dehydratase small subunit
LPIEVDEAAWQRLAACEAKSIVVDLEPERLELPDGSTIDFAIEGFARQCLLRGVDQLGYLLLEADAISAYEHGEAA